MTPSAANAGLVGPLDGAPRRIGQKCFETLPSGGTAATTAPETAIGAPTPPFSIYAPASTISKLLLTLIPSLNPPGPLFCPALPVNPTPFHQIGSSDRRLLGSS